jgi:anti-sigma factor RsiW
MVCSFPPELPNDELLAYVNGEAGEHVAAHIARCAGCRERAQALARAEGRLIDAFYRSACPTAHELGEYVLGMLAGERVRSVAAHLADCPHCAKEAAQLASYLEMLRPDIEVSPLRRMHTLVAELIHGAQRGAALGLPRLAPAYAGLRGAEEGGTLIYRAGDWQATLETEEDEAQPGRRVLLGLLTGPALPGALARLWRSDAEVAAAPVDQVGNFTLAGVEPGDYALVIESGEVEIRIQVAI